MKVQVLEQKQIVWYDGRGDDGTVLLEPGIYRLEGKDRWWILANYGYDRSIIDAPFSAAQPGDTVAIIREMGMGDVWMTTPVVRAMAARDGLRVHYWTLQRYLPLFEGNPHIEGAYNLGTTTASPDTDDMDYTIMLRKAVELDGRANDMPRTDLFASIVGYDLDGQSRVPDYYATDEELQAADSLWGSGPPRAALVARASTTSRTWQHMGELSARLAAQGVRCGILDHEPTACWEGRDVRNFGGVGMRESIALVATADVLVSHDTGLMYAGPATGTPSIALYGCWPPRLRLDKMPNVTMFDANKMLGRDYCYDIGHCDGSQLNVISVAQVQKAALAWIDGEETQANAA